MTSYSYIVMWLYMYMHACVQHTRSPPAIIYVHRQLYNTYFVAISQSHKYQVLNEVYLKVWENVFSAPYYIRIRAENN